jgi:acetyltransferase-like isoleucine patch superfamily enzyme
LTQIRRDSYKNTKGGVDIGDLVMIGPNVNIITAGHPVEASKRRAYIEAKPIAKE